MRDDAAENAGRIKALNDHVGQHLLLHLALNVHRNRRGEPMSFATMPYLVELYIAALSCGGFDLMSAVQTGKTELMILIALATAGWKGGIAAYILPKDGKRDSFVQSRIDPMLLTVPEYRERLAKMAERSEHPTTGNLKLKRFGGGELRFMGSNSAAEFLEFTADRLIIDEIDHCDQGNIELAYDRLRESKVAEVIRIGNPTLPRTGIAKLFDQGDGRRWHHRCYHCDELQPLDWMTNIVERTKDGWRIRDAERADDEDLDIRPVCRACGKPFERLPLGARWIASRPNAKRRSYHITRLDILHESLRSLWLEWLAAQGETSKTEIFYRSVLGIPYEMSGAKIAVEDIDRCATGPAFTGEIRPKYGDEDEDGSDSKDEEPAEDVPRVAGIDVGAYLHLVVDDLRRTTNAKGDEVQLRELVYADTFGSFEALIEFLLDAEVDVVAIDAAPELHKAQEFAEALSEEGISCWLVRYHPTERITSEKYGKKIDEDAGVITVDRTQLLDTCLDEIRARPPLRRFPSSIFSVPDFSEQLRAPVRKLDDKGRRYIWAETSADHYAHANAYARVAADMWGEGGFFEVW